jgi:O-antigen ligase
VGVEIDDRHATMTDVVAIRPPAPAMDDAPASDGGPGTRAGGVAVTALMLLPGALVVFMGFNAGGYFPAAPAVAAIVLAQILLVRIMLSRNPFEGLAPATFVAIGALSLYAALTLASALWSHSSGRALIEFDRACLYLLVLILFGTVRASASNMRWLIRGLALGASIVCLAGLISRVAPDVWHTAPDVANERLSYPVTYWNALGLLAALGIVFTLHLTCTLGERRSVRVLAAAVLPLLAATLFFTFSRGAMAAGAVGLVVYVLIARPSALLSGVLATAAPTAALILIAYHADLLDTVDPTTPAAVAQGHRVALAALVCVAACAALRLWLAAQLDPHLRRSGMEPRMSTRARVATIGGAATAAVVVMLALGVPQNLAHDWNRFLSGATPRGNHGDLRQRLSDPSDNGRSELWQVALQGFAASPAHGRGAGMYQAIWDQKRPHSSFNINAHSLYLQAMAELGVPGLVLLVVLVGTVLGGLGVRARGPRRSLYGALLAASVVWALHAGVDWDWEMPVITLPFFAAAGLALSPRTHAGLGRGATRARLGPRATNAGRLVLAPLCLAAVVLGVLMIGSQSRLTDAEHALYASDCAKADSAARSSIRWLSARPQPYEILGFCDLRRGLPRLGVSAMGQALRRDPGSWESYYALAIAQASAGIDPRVAAERALRMNPLEPLTRQAVKVFSGSSPTKWVKRAPVVRAAALASNDLSIVPS